MRTIVLVCLLSSLSASADVTVPRHTTRGFAERVTALARDRGQRLVDWWAVNLDGDANLELVAVLFDEDGNFGDFIIEKGPKQRWDVRFYADGRTSPSFYQNRSRLTATPRPRPSHGQRPNTIAYRQGHRAGYADQLLALRNGRIAVVYEEEVDDARLDDRPIATDWDVRVRRKEAADYRYIERSGDPGYGDLVLRSAD